MRILQKQWAGLLLTCLLFCVMIVFCVTCRIPPARTTPVPHRGEVKKQSKANLPTKVVPPTRQVDPPCEELEKLSDAPSPLGVFNPQNDWPVIDTGVESRYFSSFDRRGGNDDGFSGRFSTLYQLPKGENVIFDAVGPGVLNTLWFTGPREGGEGLDLGTIRFYFDDEKTPRIETTVEKMFGGKKAPFLYPLVNDNHQSSGGFVSWVPLPFKERLLVTTQRQPRFYIAQYDIYPVDRLIKSWTSGFDYSTLLTAFSKALKSAPTPGLKTYPLHYRHRGAGTIERIQFEPSEKATEKHLNRARIKIYWDGEKAPSVNLPLGMFFGSGLGEAKVRSIGFMMKKGLFENRFPMPFWKGFEINVQGAVGKLRLQIGKERFDKERAGTFHAVYRENAPTKPGMDFEWIDQKGRGKLVGTVLTIRPLSKENKRWWEGDLRSYTDGRRTPSMHGTGHEDDHLGGWSNTFFKHPFSLPMHGEPKAKIIEEKGVQYNAQITLYRLWPGINFSGSLRHSVEHGDQNRVQSNYAGAAFYYLQKNGKTLVQTDRLVLRKKESREKHACIGRGKEISAVLDSAFEGREYHHRFRAVPFAHTGPARFKMSLFKNNQGCYLRKLFDQINGRQRARVLVDGRFLAEWYIVEENPYLRWAERDLFLPASVTAGKSSLTIKIQPFQSAPEWSAAEYSLWCVPE